jgi:FkbM family methyltransferase
LADVTSDPTKKPDHSVELLMAEGQRIPLLPIRKAEQSGQLLETVERQKTRELQEHKRLLYVAITRAEERLIMAGSLGISRNGEPPTEKICYRYWKKLDKTIKVDVHSTGHMAFHTSYLKFKITDLPYKKMTDIIVAKMAKDRGLDMFTIPRPDGWIRYNQKMNNVGRYTMCGDFDWTDDSVQCALINSSWKTPRRYGKDYGDYTLPVGRLNENSVVYSFGLGEDSRFDEEIINEFGCVVHIFDPTPRSIAFYKNFLSDNKNIRFHDYGLWKEDTTVKFYGPRNHDHISASIDNLQHTTEYFTAQVKRLETIMQELGHEKIDVLKLDIEGAEYDVFYDMINSGIRPGVMTFELHHPSKMNVGEYFDRYDYELMKTAGSCLTYEER